MRKRIHDEDSIQILNSGQWIQLVYKSRSSQDTEIKYNTMLGWSMNERSYQIHFCFSSTKFFRKRLKLETFRSRGVFQKENLPSSTTMTLIQGAHVIRNMYICISQEAGTITKYSTFRTIRVERVKERPRRDGRVVVVSREHSRDLGWKDTAIQLLHKMCFRFFSLGFLFPFHRKAFLLSATVHIRHSYGETCRAFHNRRNHYQATSRRNSKLITSKEDVLTTTWL